MDFSIYMSPTPRLQLEEDYQAGLQNLSSIKNFFNSVLDNLDNLKEKLHMFNVVYRDKNINEFKDIKKLQGKVEKIISVKKYENVKNIKIAGLSGLKSLSIAAETLPEIIDSVNNTTLKGLEEVEKILAEFIADTDIRKAFSFRYSSALGVMQDAIYDIDYKISGFVDLSMIADSMPIEKVIPNLQTLVLVYDKLYKAGEKTNTAELAKINKKVKDISEKVDILADIIERNPDSFTKTSINGLADVLSNYSKQIKTHSLVYYLTAEVLKIYLNIVDVVEDSKL